MDPLVCPLLNLVVYFEHIRDEATSKGNLFPDHRNRGISNFLSNIFESEHFPATNKIRKLGTHSILKGAVTYASRNGLVKDWISKHGRWRGKAQMVYTYMDTYQVCFFYCILDSVTYLLTSLLLPREALSGCASGSLPLRLPWTLQVHDQGWRADRQRVSGKHCPKDNGRLWS